MAKNQKIIINSSLHQELSRNWGSEIVYKIQISSLVNDKITIHFDNFESKKNKIPFIAQCDASWIRIHFKDNTYLDFVSEEIFVLGSNYGILINLLGDCYEFTNDLLVKKIINYARLNNIKKVTIELQFNYKRQIGKKIKKNLNELMKKKNDIFINKLDYFKERKRILKEAIELLVEKRFIEDKWDNISYKVLKKLEGPYE